MNKPRRVVKGREQHVVSAMFREQAEKDEGNALGQKE